MGCRGVLVLAMLELALAGCEAAAPPPGGAENLGKRLITLAQQVTEASHAGNYSEALKRKQEELALRRQWLGGQHWQTIDTTFEVARLRGLACLPGDKQKAVADSERQMARAAITYRQGRYALAESAYRDTLAILQKLLGEEHALTAQCHNNVALCLQYQGKPRQASPLHEKALAIRTKLLGKEHPSTATSYNNLAGCLQGQGKAAEAIPLFRRALEIQQKVLGEQHPDTASSYNNLASCLDVQGKAEEALTLYEKALGIYRNELGEEHLQTANSYNSLATCLQGQGRGEEALPLHEKALTIRKKLLDEEHPDTANSYANVATCLAEMGKSGEALLLHERALSIVRKVLGEEHPHTAASYNNLASCLNEQGKKAEALPLYERALAIVIRTLGKEHPLAATSFNNVALCLQGQGKSGQALPLFENAQSITKKVLGEHHPLMATRYNGVALCSTELGKVNEALPLFEKALSIRQEVFGEYHPATATSYFNLGMCLARSEKRDRALPLLEKSLAIRQQVLGPEHPSTSSSALGLALSLYELGKLDEAIRTARGGLAGHEVSRVLAANTGFERARFHADHLSLRELLALMLARKGEAVQAWRHLEENLGRGLLDDHAGIISTEDVRLRSNLARIDGRLLPLFGRGDPSPDQKQLRGELIRQRRALLADAARRDARRSASLVWSLEQIQKHIPSETALVTWLAVKSESRVCLVRRTGDPVWVRLEGSGRKGGWTSQDVRLPEELYQALGSRELPGARRERLLDEARKRLVAPLREHLKETPTLPPVRRLVVVPVGAMIRLPLEALTSEYVVSYAPSMTAYARSQQNHRPLSATTLLALGDPAFQISRNLLAEPPKTGLLVSRVVRGGMAARAGIEAGDVLLEYDMSPLKSLEDLVTMLKRGQPAEVVYWRNGELRTVRLTAGPLGVALDRRPAAEAVRAWREAETSIVRGQPHVPLPGTRYEVEALRRLVGESSTTMLLGSQANDVVLEEMAKADRLKGYRLIHLATHGKIDLERPELSALVLAQDRLPGQKETLERAAKGLPLHDGMLRVQTIWRDWKLDADLVTLSACDSALGPFGRGDGLLGFAHVLMLRGARSVVLSRWKVDDTATALLMLRFYENLLGSRKGTKALPRAEALHEAKRWLSELPRAEAESLAMLLPQGKLTSTSRGSVVVLKTGEKKPTLPTGHRPYVHPSYWAAFTLIGDTD